MTWSQHSMNGQLGLETGKLPPVSRLLREIAEVAFSAIMAVDEKTKHAEIVRAWFGRG
jgi:hypothetical protein